MSNRNLILTLAKVIIAAAWADNQVTNDEINSLKDLLFRLPRSDPKGSTRLSAREWATLDMYIETPVDAAERAQLVQQLQDALRTPRDRELALLALNDLIQADGTVTDQELAVMEEIESAINAVDLGIFAQLTRLIQGPIQRRTQAVATAPNREQFLEEFIKNKVFYAVRQRLHSNQVELDIPERLLRKLSLAGGLMARVAHVDRRVVPKEIDTIVSALQGNWEISHEAANLVAEVAASEAATGLDFFRLTREFTNLTSEEERIHFLDILFAVADADGEISRKEVSEIRRIASSLNLTRRQFADARLKTL